MNQRRLLLVGWDSADWKLIHPLVDGGRMPALSRLLDTGVSGNLTTIEPQLSPMLWTSIATGKHAYHHGVPGFTEVNATGQVVPVSAATRRCKALWDILGERDLKTHVVGWFATQGEQPKGCLVSNLYHSWKHREEDDPSAWPPPPPGTYWPEDLGHHLDQRRVSPWDIDPDEVLRLLVPAADKVDQTKDKRLWFLAKQLGEAFSVQAATCWLMENRPDWNLFAVYFRAIDEICHRFMPFHPPQMPGAGDREFELYQHVVAGAYRLHDLMLARLVNLAGPDTAVVLVSDHGFHSDHLRPRFTPKVPAGITVWHRPQGVLCAAGPGFKHDANVFGARLLDIAPTILTWFGLPVGADMEGRVLMDAFATAPTVERIPTWESTGTGRRHASPLLDGDSKQLLDQFVALGYIDPLPEDPSAAATETNRENDWNLARACMDGGRHEAALPLLEEVWQRHPERGDYAQMLAICRLRLGLHKEAREAIEACLETVDGRTPTALVMLANIALESGDAVAAMDHLKQAEAAAAAAPVEPDLRSLEVLGRCQLALRQWDSCEDTCRRALQLDPHNPAALLGLARCAIHAGRAAESVDHALDAIGVQYGNPAGHFLLGAALLQLQQWHEAIQALHHVIKLAPTHAAACRLLAVALHRSGQAEAAEGALLMARRNFQTNSEQQQLRLTQLRRDSISRAEALRRKIRARLEPSRPVTETSQPACLPPDCEFVIVTGLPRSGTSLMMQILRAGGLEPMTDRRRSADADNPRGYWEWEDIRQLPGNPLLIEKAHGKAVKVVAPLLGYLPGKHRYKVLFMIRPVDQVVASQEVMLERRGAARTSTTGRLRALQHEQVSRCMKAMRESPRVEMLEVEYPDLVANPQPWIERLTGFLGERIALSSGIMDRVVKPELHRQRAGT